MSIVEPQRSEDHYCALERSEDGTREETLYWCCILKIVRTAFAAVSGEESFPRNFENAEPHR